MLTNEQCDEFRRLPLSFNDMVRAITKPVCASPNARQRSEMPLREVEMRREEEDGMQE